MSKRDPFGLVSFCTNCRVPIPKETNTCPICGVTYHTDDSTDQVLPTEKTDSVVSDFYGQDGPKTSVITDRSVYIDYYLPLKFSMGLYASALLTHLMTAILLLLMIAGKAEYSLLFCVPYVLSSMAMTLWVTERRDLLSTLLNLAYTGVLAVLTYFLVGTVFFYPMIPAVACVLLAAVIDRKWKLYSIRPTEYPTLSAMRMQKLRIKRFVMRIFVVVLSVILLIMSLLPAFFNVHLLEREENFSEGTYIGRKYQNEFLNIEISVPPLWHVASQNELVNYAARQYGDDYNRNTYKVIYYAENYTEDSGLWEGIEIHVITQPYEVSAKEFINVVAGDYQRYANQYSRIDTERADPVKVGGRSYQVLHSTFVAYPNDTTRVSFEEYMLVRPVGHLTVAIYLYPGPDNSFEELLNLIETINE